MHWNTLLSYCLFSFILFLGVVFLVYSVQKFNHNLNLIVSVSVSVSVSATQKTLFRFWFGLGVVTCMFRSRFRSRSKYWFRSITITYPYSFFFFLNIFFGVTCPFWLSLLFSFIFLPSSGSSYPSSFEANLGIEPTSKDHGSDCESFTFTTRPGSFPLTFTLPLFYSSVNVVLTHFNLNSFQFLFKDFQSFSLLQIFLFRCQDKICQRFEGETQAQKTLLGNNVWTGIWHNEIVPLILSKTGVFDILLTLRITFISKVIINYKSRWNQTGFENLFY